MSKLPITKLSSTTRVSVRIYKPRNLKKYCYGGIDSREITQIVGRLIKINVHEKRLVVQTEKRLMVQTEKRKLFD